MIYDNIKGETFEAFKAEILAKLKVLTEELASLKKRLAAMEARSA